MPNHRHTVKTTIKVQDHAILHRVNKEPNLRVMVFCAAEDKPGQDIAFPHQSEVKVNGGDIKANLRGLKSKPGSTRPVDITKELRLNLPAYGNLVEMTYALTSKAGGAQPVRFSSPTPYQFLPHLLYPFAPKLMKSDTNSTLEIPSRDIRSQGSTSNGASRSTEERKEDNRKVCFGR